MRLAYATIFAIVPYSSAERTLKPFNPILGETFEWTTKDARFIAEQVRYKKKIRLQRTNNEMVEKYNACIIY